MPTLTGYSISMYKTDRLGIDLTVNDKDTGLPKDLTGYTATFSYWKKGETPVVVACTIFGSVISVVLLTSITSLMGYFYKYNFKLILDGEPNILIEDSLEVI